jgi:hypothetical protein
VSDHSEHFIRNRVQIVGETTRTMSDFTSAHGHQHAGADLWPSAPRKRWWERLLAYFGVTD